MVFQGTKRPVGHFFFITLGRAEGQPDKRPRLKFLSFMSIYLTNL